MDGTRARPAVDRRGPRAVQALLVVLGLVLGVLAVVAGEADDSPGLQGLGVLLAAGAVAFGVRTARRRPR